MYKFFIYNFLLTFINSAKHILKTKRTLFIIGTIIWLLLEFFIGLTFYIVFNYLINYFPGGVIFAPKIFAITMMSVFNVTVFIAFVSTIPTLYKSTEVNFLLTSPVDYEDMFKYGLFKVFFYSLWGSIVILIPCFVGYGIVNKFNLFYYIFSLFVVLAFTQLAVSIGVLLVLIIFKFLFGLRKSIIKIILGVFFVSILGWIISKIPSLTQQSEETGISAFEGFIMNYDYSNLLLPYNWFSKLIEYVTAGDIIGILSYLSFIIFSILGFFILISYLGKKFYFDSLKNFEKFGIFKKTSVVTYKTPFGTNKYFNLIWKDFLVHIKDPVQWTQMLIFMILLLVYIITLKGTTLRGLNNVVLIGIVTAAGVGITGFFISAIALRFVFPNISLEGKSFWILRTIPISMKMMYFLKLIFFGFTTLVLSLILSYFYVQIIGIKSQLAWVIYFMIVPLIVFIVCVFFVLGSMYTDFKENNPSKISTSMPGFMGIFLSNFGIFLAAICFYPIVVKYYQYVYNCITLGFGYFKYLLLGVYLIFIILIYSLVYYGMKKFTQIEY